MSLPPSYPPFFPPVHPLLYQILLPTPPGPSHFACFPRCRPSLSPPGHHGTCLRRLHLKTTVVLPASLSHLRNSGKVCALAFCRAAHHLRKCGSVRRKISSHAAPRQARLATHPRPLSSIALSSLPTRAPCPRLHSLLPTSCGALLSLCPRRVINHGIHGWIALRGGCVLQKPWVQIHTIGGNREVIEILVHVVLEFPLNEALPGRILSGNVSKYSVAELSPCIPVS